MQLVNIIKILYPLLCSYPLVIIYDILAIHIHNNNFYSNMSAIERVKGIIVGDGAVGKTCFLTL